jgi:hypothetical protein
MMNARGDVATTTAFCATGMMALHYENDSWPPISGARIKRRDLQSNY